MTTSPHTLQQKIEDILRSSSPDGEDLSYVDISFELLQLFKSTVEEVIKTDIVMYEQNKDISYHRIREDLRSEQRQALEDIISGKKGL